MRATWHVGKLCGNKTGWTMIEYCAMASGVILALIGRQAAYQNRAMQAAQEIQQQFMPTIGNEYENVTAEPLLSF